MVESLHGNTTRIDSSSIQEYVEMEENDPHLINAIESILSTRLSEEVYCGLINLMNTFSPNTSTDDIEKALVSHMEFVYSEFNYFYYDSHFLNSVHVGILIWTQ